MQFAVNEIVSNKKIENIFNTATETVNRLGMMSYIKKGVAVGFSGGADSVMLLLFLNHLKQSIDFPLCAIHINHMIRGAEADFDMNFSQEFAKALDIPFFSESYDIPRLAKEAKCGTEEIARKVRYSAFSAFISSKEEYQTVATAHNSTDNLETVIFNLTRGSGASGIKGISPIRDNIIRPLIEVSKKTITEALNEARIPYVTDSTNASNEYTRNYIRHDILPKLRNINPMCESAVTRLSNTIRQDNDYLYGISKKFIKDNKINGYIASKRLSELHISILARVIKIWLDEICELAPESVHINAITALIYKKKGFKIDVPGGMSFVSDGYRCTIERKAVDKDSKPIVKTPLNLGINIIPELDIAILVSKDKNEFFSSNVYKFSIQENLGSDIIEKDLFVRTKQPGDSYRTGGITRKLKKLFNDRKIPPSLRNKIPVICDSEGIIWVAGFAVRDNQKIDKNKQLWVTIYLKNA